MKRKWLLGTFLPLFLLGGCGGVFPPPEPPLPTPPPDPCADSPVAGWPWCHELDPPAECGECRHQPPGEECPIAAPECPEPPPPLPQPQCPTFTNRGGVKDIQGDACDCYMGQVWQPCPEPPPITGCFHPQGVPFDEAEWGEPTTILGTQVNAAMERVTRCPTGSDCPTGMAADEFFALVTADLRSTGLCAGRFRNTPPGASDSIGVAVDCKGTWEGYHVYNYGGGKVVWSPNAARETWTLPPRYCTSEPPATDCPQPDTDSMKFNLEKKTNHWDSTWITVGQPDYCASIGYCCMPGTGTPPNTCGSPGCIPRGGCPILPDGHPDRAKCERLPQNIGQQQWWCNGQPIGYFNNNPAQGQCTGTVMTCTENGKTCGEATW